MFNHPNILVLLNYNGLGVQSRGCAIGVPLGALVLRIPQCVRDGEEIMVFRSSVFYKK